MSQSNDHLEDSLLHLEEELRALVPAETSVGLRDRIFAALAETPAVAPAETAITPPGRGWFGWVPLAAAAAVALLAVVLSPAPHGPAGVVTASSGAAATPLSAGTPLVAPPGTLPASWKPVSSDSRLEHVGYDGIRTEESATYRQIRTRSMERRTFVDPTDGTVVEVVFPRENIHLVPVVPE
jgi:hypothetical protein